MTSRPSQAGHGNIDDRHIRPGAVHLLNGLLAVGGFGHHLDVARFFDNADQAAPDNAVVVGQQDSDQFETSAK